MGGVNETSSWNKATFSRLGRNVQRAFMLLGGWEDSPLGLQAEGFLCIAASEGGCWQLRFGVLLRLRGGWGLDSAGYYT